MIHGTKLQDTTSLFNNTTPSHYQEKLCYMALDYNKELQKPDSAEGVEKAYELPDGQVIKVFGN